MRFLRIRERRMRRLKAEYEEAQRDSPWWLVALLLIWGACMVIIFFQVTV